MRAWLLGAVLILLTGCAGLGGGRAGTVERMYVFNCGESRVEDLSRWTPGVNVGKPWEFRVIIIATPGHTPGHQSLLVRLPKTGPVILSGDMVHLQDNWAHRRVPSFNFDREQSLKSMEKVAAIMQRTGAKLWINHDKAQSDTIPKAPAFVE